jgi:hypothetical protein
VACQDWENHSGSALSAPPRPIGLTVAAGFMTAQIDLNHAWSGYLFSMKYDNG